MPLAPCRELSSIRMFKSNIPFPWQVTGEGVIQVSFQLLAKYFLVQNSNLQLFLDIVTRGGGAHRVVYQGGIQFSSKNVTNGYL